MDLEQRIQEEEYQFPYHYIANFDNGNFIPYVSYPFAHIYSVYIQYIANLILERKPVSLCDIGCGDGFFLNYLSGLTSKINLTGVDYSQKAINLAKAMNTGLHFECINILKDKRWVKQNEYQTITSIAVLEHIPPSDINLFIESHYQLLSKNGSLFLAVPSSNYPVSKKHYQHFSVDDVKELFGDRFEFRGVFCCCNLNHFWFKLLTKVLLNKVFLVKHQVVLNWLFNRCLEADRTATIDNAFTLIFELYKR